MANNLRLIICRAKLGFNYQLDNSVIKVGSKQSPVGSSMSNLNRCCLLLTAYCLLFLKE